MKRFPVDKKSKEKTNLADFTFCDHKSTFESLLVASGQQEFIVEDKYDFWKFVNKYESMLRNAGQSLLNDPLSLQDDLIENPKPFHKRKFIGLDIKRPTDASYPQRCTDSKYFTQRKIEQFFEIILIYLDFKQKEKFTKVKKLRKAQQSLPIAKFKKDIKNLLDETQVLLIAGDTGCGKSTQVPQFLYEFGFQNIGNF